MQQLKLFLGGTFDPLHLGHIHLAYAAQQELEQDIYWLPCNVPIHKSPAVVSIEHRIKMLGLLVDAVDSWHLDLMEVDVLKPQSSYDTFIKNQQAHQCLLIGADSLATVPTWHDWQLLNKQLHLVVLNRYNNPLVMPQELKGYFKVARDKNDLYKSESGCILVLNQAVKCIDSTKIRSLLANQAEIARALLPEKIFDYIIENQLYANIK